MSEQYEVSSFYEYPKQTNYFDTKLFCVYELRSIKIPKKEAAFEDHDLKLSQI